MNIGVESQFIKDPKLLKENLPDFAMGMIAILIGLSVANTIISKFSVDTSNISD